MRREPLVVFDLGIDSPLLNGDPKENEEPKLTKRLNALMEEADVKVGVGQYDEARYIYTSPAFAVSDDFTDETRTIHLGIDLFAEVGTPVRAPLAGKIVAFADNAAEQDYGPVVVVEHSLTPNPLSSPKGAPKKGEGDSTVKFYTLYGHLTRESLKSLKTGQKLKRGQKFAEIGSAKVNGNWTPHLHFQIMVDTLGLDTDFPDVALPSQRDVWLSLCPDPNLILNIPKKSLPKKSPTKDETLAVRRQRLGGNLSLAYRSPVKIVRGWMQYLHDEHGKISRCLQQRGAHRALSPQSAGSGSESNRRVEHEHSVSA